MADLVTVDEMKAHLRIATDEEDSVIDSLITQAEAAALDYCRVDSFDDPTPEPVRLAVMLFTSHFFEVRDGSDKSAYDTTMQAFHSLLYPYRDKDTFF